MIALGGLLCEHPEPLVLALPTVEVTAARFSLNRAPVTLAADEYPSDRRSRQLSGG
jgi:hypothetical protein